MKEQKELEGYPELKKQRTVQKRKINEDLAQSSVYVAIDPINLSEYNTNQITILNPLNNE